MQQAGSIKSKKRTAEVARVLEGMGWILTGVRLAVAPKGHVFGSVTPNRAP
jgi:hypothetical protein